MSTERPPVDYLAEAKTAAGQVHTDQATMYALVSIAESLSAIAQLMAANAAETYTAAVVEGAKAGDLATAETIGTLGTLIGGQLAAEPDATEQCFHCGSTDTHDTNWGWECRSCGAYDVAQGCVKP